MKIGEKIRQLRKENNLTQQQLADKLFVTPQAVSKWENNLVIPTTDKISDLAQIFQVDIQYFFDDKNVQTDNKKWQLLWLNAIYYFVTLVAIYTFSPKINHNFFSMIVSTIIFFTVLVILIVFFHKYQIKYLYRYALAFGFFDVLWFICIAAVFILK
ncbi:hypothetical protein C5L30_001392 [Companilactobacillus farciminis]|uniref:HTH cro/C1-type domain-containing protein n=2 Tax=Companilactobacillus farciminis TaxID=1612 RepID=A0A4R5ND39_9LACO|nr:helix-turn-helix transcriptional regulator [Companilactobacillus farciminis]ATO46383.1 hypothetical protein LF20184_06265 [Companilactobacillus farciminis KCTC 3681 = DSM 20184]KRK61578.1 HTH-type transcriptional regulator rdgA [Companilactobacillus farciminis KCTC 3681 = DSM 20184]TDG70601.1 hypothetical protein C5L30_001392 [Companilactobacillus farciminis]